MEKATDPEYLIQANWDEEARVWVATSADVHGLAVEAETCEQVIEIVEDVLPSLFTGNGLGHGEVSLLFHRRQEAVQLSPAGWAPPQAASSQPD